MIGFHISSPGGYCILKQLPDFREELTIIYNQLKPSGLTDRAIQSIEDVTNPMLDSINEKCARIRAAFVGQLSRRVWRTYRSTSGEKGDFWVRSFCFYCKSTKFL